MFRSLAFVFCVFEDPDGLAELVGYLPANSSELDVIALSHSALPFPYFIYLFLLLCPAFLKIIYRGCLQGKDLRMDEIVGVTFLPSLQTDAIDNRLFCQYNFVTHEVHPEIHRNHYRFFIRPSRGRGVLPGSIPVSVQ